MSTVHISAGGTKKEVTAAVSRESSLTGAQIAGLTRMINSVPGTHISLSGDIRTSEDAVSGSFEFRASFWTQA